MPPGSSANRTGKRHDLTVDIHDSCGFRPQRGQDAHGSWNRGAWLSEGVAVSAPGIEFGLLDGKQAAEHAGELLALHGEVYAEAPYRRDENGEELARRFAVQRRQPGFVLAEARHGDYLVGYASGMPLRPSTSWW